MSTLHNNASAEEIEDEISFIDVLISSLDPDADDYQTELGKHQRAKTDLERRLDAMQFNPGPANHGQFGMDGANEHANGDAQWWQVAMNGRPASIHSTSSTSLGNQYGGSGNPFELAMNGNKRIRPESSYLDDRSNKRLTPEPANSMASSSHAASHEFGSERAQMRQRQAEAAIRRQQADAAFARQLSQTNNFSNNHFGSSSTPNPSSSRPPFQTLLNSDGSYQRRPQPLNPSPSPLSAQNHMQPALSAQTPPHSYIKAEPSSAGRQHHQLAQRPRQPPAVVDLTGSDSEADEELTEIAPNNFTPNQRQPPPMLNGHRSTASGPLHTPAPTSMDLPTTMQMPGAFPSGPQPGSYVYGNGNMNGVHGAQNVHTYRSPFLGQAMNSIRNASSTLDNQMQQLSDLVYGSSRSRPVNLSDEDSDDVIFGGSRQISGFGNYAGNEDLYRDRYNDLANYDPSRSKEELEALLQNIRPDEDMPAHLRVTTPADMDVKLHKYQELGLTWLKQCEEGSNKGGILADDMGLGKTIQMLALMVERKSEDPMCKTTLIIAPVALMRQWKQEIFHKLKRNRKLKVFTHHGQSKKKDYRELQAYDVVLTTYGSIGAELKRLEAFRLRQRNDPEARPYPKEKVVLLDDNATWYRVILDEAQCIKNRGTQTAKAACLLKAKYRHCVTGTPMMNNVEEFYSLIKFLRIKPYSDWNKFRMDINSPLRSPHADVRGKAMQMLQALCKAIMLRRTKKSTFEGKPILILPERSTMIDNPTFDQSEREFYTALETQSRLDFNKYLRRGEVGKQYTAILVLLLRLRQACCHPHLIKDFGVAAAADLNEEQMLDFARQLDPSVVERIKSTGGNFECPVCYDVTPNPAIFIPCGHDTCSECFSRIADPTNAIQNGDENAGVRCPNCRGGIDPKRLTDFLSFKKVHMPELLTDQEREDSGVVMSDEGDEEDDTDDSDSDDEDEEFEGKDLGGFIVPDNKDEYEPDEDSEQEEGAAGPSNKSMSKGKGKGKKKSEKSKGKKKTKALTMAELKAQASKNKRSKEKYLRRLAKDYVGSAKLDKTMEILKEIVADEEGEKVLVFSQWTSLLDLLEVPISAAKMKYSRYDGSLSAAARGDAVDDFRDPAKNVRIMLVSLKAGNAGLNLNMASQVIILDPFWNPYIEEQAIDRAHRLGQTRPVTVHKILITNSVEDRIVALQEKKRALISEALDEQQASNIGRLGVQELAYLFGITHDPSQRINYTERQTR